MKALPIIVIVFLISCRMHTRWTEKQRAEFAEECSSTDAVKDLAVSFTGFAYNEIQQITVKQIHREKIIDSFYLHPDTNSFDSLRLRYSARINRSLYIKDTFKIIVKGYPPFMLSDMKMIMWEQFTMFSEGYGCVMGDYKIDGVRFEHNASPDFKKRGFKYSWEK